MGKGVFQYSGSGVVSWRFESDFHDPPVDDPRVRKGYQKEHVWIKG